MTHDAKLHDSVPMGLAPSLYNLDLAPTRQKGRTWKSYNLFALWANDVHSLGNYSFVIGLFVLGLGVWQVLVALAFASLFLFVLLSLSGLMGFKTGVPFPVLSRISFGIFGAHIPALIRGIVAIVWFGIQTYLATMVLNVLLIAFFPSLTPMTHHLVLGLSVLGWISFAFLWVIQVILACYGMEVIRKYEAFVGPIILFTFLMLAIWVLYSSGGHLRWSPPKPLSGSEMWSHIFGAAALWVSIYATFLLNFCDFTRSAVSRQTVIKGNFWGIIVNVMFFGVIAMILAGGQLSIDGVLIHSASDVVRMIPNTALLVLASLSLLILTIAVNLMANFVAPCYTLSNLLPRYLNFRRAALVTGIIGFVILPWNLYDSPVVIDYFLGGLGALLGPLFGIVMIDYWLVRKQRVDIPALYIDSPSGSYHYSNGVNAKAVQALIPSALIAILFALLPQLSSISQFSWFIGAALGAVIYYFIAPKNQTYADRDGESIAVATRH